MKKLLMTLTLALAAAIAIPAAAQTATNTQSAKECCKEKKNCAKQEGKTCAKAEGQSCCKEGKPDRMKDLSKSEGRRFAGDRKEMGGKRKGAENPLFKGITLSDEQQKKLTALQESRKADEKKATGESKKKDRAEMMKLRADFEKEVEKILDKDQLKQYQANKAELQARRAAKGKKR